MFRRSMLSDRSYMHNHDESHALSTLKWLLGTLAAVFVIENIVLRWFGGGLATGFFHTLTLAPESFKTGFVWTLLTHGLIHDPNNLFDLAFTALGILVFGRPVIAEIGSKRFLQVFAAAVVLGGVTWLAVNWTHAERLFGASAGVSGLLVLFACLNPEQPIALFMIDVGLRAKHLAIGLLCIDVLGLLLVEIPGHSSWFAMAHSAHLGGMAAGWLYYRATHLSDTPWFRNRPAIELPRWFRRSKQPFASAPVFKVNLTGTSELKAEVDRILDKINSHGFQSLSTEEKARLDQAREHLSRR